MHPGQALRTVAMAAGVPDCGAAAPACSSTCTGSVLVAVRDLHRHPWQQRLVADMVASRLDTVVVELGLEFLLQPARGGYVATGGAPLVSCQAAADVLAGTGAAT